MFDAVWTDGRLVPATSNLFSLSSNDDTGALPLRPSSAVSSLAPATEILECVAQSLITICSRPKDFIASSEAVLVE